MLKALGSATDSPVVTRNCSFYFIRVGCFRRGQTFYPARMAAVTMGLVHSIDIDTQEDFEVAEAIVAQRNCVRGARG